MHPPDQLVASLIPNLRIHSELAQRYSGLLGEDAPDQRASLEQDRLQSLKLKREFIQSKAYSSTKLTLLNVLLDSMTSSSSFTRPEAILCFLTRLIDASDSFKENNKELQKNSSFHVQSCIRPREKQPQSNKFFFQLFIQTFPNYTETRKDLFIREALIALQGIESSFLKWDLLKEQFFVLSTASQKCDFAVCELLGKIGEIATDFARISAFLKQAKGQDLILRGFCQFVFGMRQVYLDEIDRMMQKVACGTFEGTLSTLVAHFSVSWHSKFKFIVQVAISKPLERLGDSLFEAASEFSANSWSEECFSCACKEYFQILLCSLWLMKGECKDYAFFIRKNLQVNEDNYWRGRFEINAALRPCFISEEMAEKILLVGKCKAFMRETMKIPLENLPGTFVDGGGGTPLSFTKIDHYWISVEFASWLNDIHSSINQQLFALYCQRYGIFKHLEGLRSTLLMQRGDFSSLLIGGLWEVLGKRSNSIFRHSLLAILEDCTKSCSFPPFIAQRVDIRLFEGFEGDLGWDLFCLDYQAREFAESILLCPGVMGLYHKIFAFLFKLQRAYLTLVRELQTLGLETNNNNNSDRLSFRMQMRKVFHFIQRLICWFQDRIITPKYTQFIGNLQNSLSFELLIDGHWEMLQSISREMFFDHVDVEIYQGCWRVIDLVCKKSACDLIEKEIAGVIERASMFLTCVEFVSFVSF